VLDQDLENTATIIGLLVDLLDDEEQKRNLLEAWNAFKIEVRIERAFFEKEINKRLQQRRQFPDLAPTASGSSFSGITSGRVLNAKRTQPSSSQRVWDRVAQAASSSVAPPATAGPGGRYVPGATAPPPSAGAPLPERFPPLHATGPAPVAPKGVAGGHRTAWSAAGAGPPRPATQQPVSVPARGGKRSGPAPPALHSSAAFPSLPATAGGPRVKPPTSGNKSLKNILGEPAPVTNPWGPGSGGGGGSSSGAGFEEEFRDGGEEGVQVQPSGGKKKGKGKQKQTLFTLGGIPS
jgi:E3 ubiquitin-protein ligase ZNF598